MAVQIVTTPPAGPKPAAEIETPLYQDKQGVTPAGGAGGPGALAFDLSAPAAPRGRRPMPLFQRFSTVGFPFAAGFMVGGVFGGMPGAIFVGVLGAVAATCSAYGK